MTKEELATIAHQLYGPHWKAKLAEEIGWSRFTVYRWAAGKTAIHKAAERRIRELATCHASLAHPNGPSTGEAEAATGPSKLPTGFPCGSLPVSLGTDAPLPATTASGASPEGPDWRGQSRKEST